MINLLSAFLLRDTAIEKNYRFHFAVKVFDIVFQLSIFYFLSRLMPGQDYFSFILAGLMFSRFFQFWLNVFAQNIRQEQYWGTAELLFLSPRPPLLVLFSSSGGKFLLLAVELLFYTLIGKYLFHAAFSFSVAGLIPVLLLTTLMFAGIGLVSGSFIMYFKRGDPANWLIATSFDVLSGVYFPLTLMPRWLQAVSALLPTTAALGAWRQAVLYHSLPSAGQMLVLSAWAAGFLLLGFFSFQAAVWHTKIKGELGSY